MVGWGWGGVGGGRGYLVEEVRDLADADRLLLDVLDLENLAGGVVDELGHEHLDGFNS